MSRWVIPIIVLTVVIIALEIYTFQAFKTISKSKFMRFTFLTLGIAVYVYFFITVFTYNRSEGQTPQFQMAMGLLLMFSIPKLVIILALFGEDIYQFETPLVVV